MQIKMLKEYPLLSRMLIYIFLFATGSTVLVTSANLYSEYYRQLNAIRSHLDTLDKSQLTSLTNNLWTLNEDGLKIQMKSILLHPDIVFEEIIYADGYVFAVGKKPLVTERYISREFELIFDNFGKKNYLGKFRVFADTNNIKNNLIDKLPILIALNFLEITFICSFISFLFILLFNRHLNRIADFAKALDLNTLENRLQLQRKQRNSNHPDELEKIVNAINEMRLRLQDGIKQRGAAERILRESEEKFRLIFSNSPLAIVHFDRNGIVKTGNDNLTKIIGASHKNIIGFDALNSINDKNMASAIANALAGKETHYEGDYLSVLGDISTPLLGSFGPIYASNGAITGAIGILTDITERRQAQSKKEELEIRLQQSQKMEAIGTLAGGIAHDFNNILAAVIGYTELALMESENSESVQKYLNEIFKGANRAKELVKQILTFSRKSEHQLLPLRVQLIVKETLKLLQSSIPATIEIRHKIDQQCQAVLADPTQIHQIIMNLCTNAYHAMRERGGVLGVSLQQTTLSAEDIEGKLHLQPGSYLKLEVSDSGTGMTKDIIANIFEPYFTTKDKEEGTGLGLAVVHGIVISLAGEVTVYSDPGRGTTFNVYLPTVAKAERGTSEALTAPLPTGNEHILLVDDDKVINEMNKTMLQRFGYKITALSSGVEACELFGQHPDRFDLIVTDMTMPKMTGAELAVNIFSIRPNIPIILCSGFSDLIDEEKAKNLGFRQYVMKPVNKKDFITIIRKTLDGN